MQSKVEKLIKARVTDFKKEVLPKLKELIKDRDEKLMILQEAENHLHEIEAEIKTLSEELPIQPKEDLNQETPSGPYVNGVGPLPASPYVECAQIAVTTVPPKPDYMKGSTVNNELVENKEGVKSLNERMASHREKAAHIVEIRSKIDTLNAVKIEIEQEIPGIEKPLQAANRALAEAAETMFRELAVKEAAEIKERTEEIVSEITSHNEAIIEFGETVLGLPRQQQIGCCDEFMLYCDSIDIDTVRKNPLPASALINLYQ